MSTARRALTAFVLVSAFALGCDSTQPDRIESRTATLTFEARADARIFDCYESPSPRCFPVSDPGVPPNPPIPRKENRSVPWPYSVKITIIRAGGVTEELATSVGGVVGSSLEPGDLVEDFISLSNYDPIAAVVADRVDGGVTYTNGHRVSVANPQYLATIFVDPGITNLLSVPGATPTDFPTFDFVLNSGDTVIVRARKQLILQSPQISPALENLKLVGRLTFSGQDVSVLGTPESPTTDGAGFTFSFTVQ